MHASKNIHLLCGQTQTHTHTCTHKRCDTYSPFVLTRYSGSRLYSLNLCPCSLFGAIKRCKIQTCVILIVNGNVQCSSYYTQQCATSSVMCKWNFYCYCCCYQNDCICVSSAINDLTLHDGLLYTKHSAHTALSQFQMSKIQYFIRCVRYTCGIVCEAIYLFASEYPYGSIHIYIYRL